jgi:hypothetical protein
VLLRICPAPDSHVCSVCKLLSDYLCGRHLDSSADKSLTDANAEVAQNPAVIVLDHAVAAEKIKERFCKLSRSRFLPSGIPTLMLTTTGP